MQKYLNVYFTELNQQIKPYLISVFVFLALSGVMLWTNISIGIMNPDGKFFITGFAFPLLFFFTQLMIFSYFLKERYLTESNYLLYSLPTKRYPVLLVKYFTFTTYLLLSLILLFFWAFAIAHSEILKAEGSVTDKRLLEPLIGNGLLFFILHHSYYFFAVKLLSLLTFLLSGIIVFLKSIRYSLKWFNVFIQTVTALLIMILFCLFGFVDTVFPGLVMGPVSVINGIATGILFLFMGLKLFEKYGQI